MEKSVTITSDAELRFNVDSKFLILREDGDIDFRESAVLLWQAGFRGWVCNEGGTGDVVRSQLAYLRYMRWILDEWIPMAESAES